MVTAGRDQYYTAKYRGTVWQLIISLRSAPTALTSVCAAAARHPVRRAGQRIGMASPQPREEGWRRLPQFPSSPALPANLVWKSDPARHAGRPAGCSAAWTGSPPTSASTTARARRPPGWPYDRWQMCWGRHTCHMGAVKALKALAAIPPDRRSPRSSAPNCAGRRVHAAPSHSQTQSRSGEGLQAGLAAPRLPLMYQTDMLEILGILTTLGYRDERMQEGASPCRWQGRRAGPLDAREHFQRPLPRADRGQGRTEPLGDP